MNNIFFILGYGIPQEILKDENYNFYLKMCFNKIYTATIKNKFDNPSILFHGGNTDCYKPFTRNESDEMIKFFKEFTKRPDLKTITKNWNYIPERKSLSTMENLLFAQKILNKNKIKEGTITIFCEYTRQKRIKILSKKILSPTFTLKIVPIDFDVSLARYFDKSLIQSKENQGLKMDLWALESTKNYKQYHKLFEEKISFLRKYGTKNNAHQKALKEWWETELLRLNI